jgi:hypothetical protein
MAPKKRVERPQENVSLGPQVREGEEVFGVARIFASFVCFSLVILFYFQTSTANLSHRMIPSSMSPISGPYKQLYRNDTP